jgi:hypothetical protein
VENTDVEEEISHHLERCLATLLEVENGLSRVVMAALYEQNIELIQTIDTWLSHFLQGKSGNGEKPRRRTKHRKSNSKSNDPEPCKNNNRNSKSEDSLLDSEITVACR